MRREVASTASAPSVADRRAPRELDADASRARLRQDGADVGD